MSIPVVEPVTGEDLCPKCQGQRVLPKRQDIKTTPILGDFRALYEGMLWDDSGNPFVWCRVCGGSGTATDAMERLLAGVLETKAA